jgi:hypothetical protein
MKAELLTKLRVLNAGERDEVKQRVLAVFDEADELDLQLSEPPREGNMNNAELLKKKAPKLTSELLRQGEKPVPNLDIDLESTRGADKG